MLPGTNIATSNRISAATLAGARRSPLGLVGSVLLHGAIIGATLFSFAHKLEITEESPPVVPVDLVTLAPKTNIMAAVKAPPKVQPKEGEPTLPEPKPQTVDTPPEPQQSPARKNEPAPAPQAVLPPPPDIAPEPVPETPKLPKTKPAPQPKADTQDKVEKPKKEEFDINNVVALLDKRDAQQSHAAKARVAEKNIKGFGPQTAMTMDLQDSLRSQIQQCWNPPVGAPHPEELVVEFQLFLKPDGSVAQPPQLSAQSESAAAHDSFTRAAAEAARRAIYTCAPYKLPADRFSQWQEITLNFDPRQMMGQ